MFRKRINLIPGLSHNNFKLIAAVIFSFAVTVCVVCMFCGCNNSTDTETEISAINNSLSESETETETSAIDNSLSESETDSVTTEVEITEKNQENNLSQSIHQSFDNDNLITNITDNDALEILDLIVSIADKYNLSISYKYDQLHYSINGSEVYESASTIKAVYCQYLLATGADFDEEIIFDTDYVRTSSSGKLTQEHKGETFTVGELIEYTLRYSDNMAYRLLFSKYGYKGFNDYVKKLGIPGLAFSNDHEFTHVTVTELTDGMCEILEYSAKDNRLTEHLINAEYKCQIASGTNYTVASKYGYQGGTKGYHDTAIVFAPAPYVLTIMSNLDPGSNSKANKPFAEITELTDALHEILCKT